MGNENRWQYLVTQYLSNQITKQELEELLQKAAKLEDAAMLTPELKAQWVAHADAGKGIDWDNRFERMMKDAAQMTEPQRKHQKKWYWPAVAAVLIMVIGTGAFFWYLDAGKKNAEKNIAKRYANDVAPGSTGAILTLANGQQIILDSTGNGTLALQGKTRIINQDGQVIYGKGHGQASAPMYNTMTTPNGRQYQLVLEDGSRVWLNAASSIRYPTAFAGKERKVEITGEVYFEIAPLYKPDGKTKLPFIVSVNGMNVEVLGTHFNIKAYNDETNTQTTLLEGKVKVAVGGMENMLKPGQQAVLSRMGTMKVMDDVDVDAVMAWKNGFFSFDQTDFGAVMRQLARWYDVEIVYAGEVPNRKFGGGISRNTNLSEVLQILEESKIYFRIEGKKIIVLS